MNLDWLDDSFDVVLHGLSRPVREELGGGWSA
jgi:hypothetical protein